MKISFLIIGFQKCGTSALNYYLKKHSEIYLPAEKELHFFDNDSYNWASPPYGESFHCHFPDPSGEQICGEATPIYIYWEPCLKRIYQYNKSMRIIVMLRDPVARAYSHWRMEKSRHAESLSFSEAIREGRKRMCVQGGVRRQHRVFSYVERGFYAAQIERLFLLFPEENVLFLNMCDLKENPTDVLDDVCDFLGIRQFQVYPTAKTIFSHEDRPFPLPKSTDISYLRSLFREDEKKLKKLIDKKIPNEF